jgi:hypothetical protein
VSGGWWVAWKNDGSARCPTIDIGSGRAAVQP